MTLSRGSKFIGRAQVRKEHGLSMNHAGRECPIASLQFIRVCG
jgi:hypothetical protein